MQKAALYTSGVFFAAGALAHITRLIADIEIVIGGFVMPVWGSFPGAVAATLLAAWMLVAARRA